MEKIKVWKVSFSKISYDLISLKQTFHVTVRMATSEIHMKKDQFGSGKRTRGAMLKYLDST